MFQFTCLFNISIQSLATLKEIVNGQLSSPRQSGAWSSWHCAIDSPGLQTDGHQEDRLTFQNWTGFFTKVLMALLSYHDLIRPNGQTKTDWLFRMLTRFNLCRTWIAKYISQEYRLTCPNLIKYFTKVLMVRVCNFLIRRGKKKQDWLSRNIDWQIEISWPEGLWLQNWKYLCLWISFERERQVVWVTVNIPQTFSR